jgi:hypothetical protein
VFLTEFLGLEKVNLVLFGVKQVSSTLKTARCTLHSAAAPLGVK